MLTVAIYHCSVAGKNNAEKINILENESIGISKVNLDSYDKNDQFIPNIKP